MPRTEPAAARRAGLGVVLLVVATVLVTGAGSSTAEAQSPRQATVDPTAAAYDADAPDPDIIRDGSTYFVYTTAGSGGHIPVLSSTDLQHWQHLGDALPTLPAWERPGQTWAPGVVVLQGQFVLFYATQRASDGEECISEATSTVPGGPFVDSSTGPLVCQPTLGGSLDPDPFVDRDGTPYLYWKSNGGAGSLPVPGDIWEAPLSADGSTLVGAPVVVLTETQPWEATVENPFMVYESGAYDLFYSGGTWDSATYGVSYAVCDSPAGPCQKPVGSPLLHSDPSRLGPGGESLVTDAGGNWWMAYAAWDGPSSDYSYAAGDFRSLWIAPVTFSGATPDIAAGEAPPGYDLAASDGGVFSFGAAAFDGSMGGRRLAAPVVAVAADPSGGYWEVAADGGVFSFGAPFYGSLAGHRLGGFVLGMAATPDGRGYWLVASDGGVFSFGDATFYGSMGGRRLDAPVLSMAATPDGGGYWLVGSDGGVFSFGDATFYGSTGSVHLTRPVVGMAAMPQGGGYWLVAADGGVFSFGSAPFYGSTGSVRLAAPVVGLVPGPGSDGYLLVAADGEVFAFADAPFLGSLHGLALARPVVGAAMA